MKLVRQAFVVLVCMPWYAHADDTEIKKTAKMLCTEISNATIKNDFKRIVELTHPNLIEKMGGKDKAIKAMADGFEQIKTAGVAINTITTGDASDVVAAKDELYLYVPITIEMSSKAGKLRQQSYVIGVSTDKGKSWLFVNGDLDVETVKGILPNLPKELKLPAHQKPIIEK